MPSAPTTSIDLTSPDVVADPYPYFAEERAAHPVAWHEQTGTWLAFDHASVSAVQRDRRLARLWRDREPAAYLEPFNLLHRNQMMENEPPEHTRLRRPGGAAFARGHVERLRPARRASWPPGCSTQVDPAGFDVIGDVRRAAAGPRHRRAAGRPGVLRAPAARLVAGDRPDVRGRPVAGGRGRRRLVRRRVRRLIRELVRERRARPRDDLLSDLAGRPTLSEDEMVASAVLLLNAGHEASVNVFGNGLVAHAASAGCARRRTVAATRRGDAPLRLRAPAVRAHRDRGRARSAASWSGRARDRRAARRGQPRPGGLRRARRVPASTATPTTTSPSGSGVHFCLGAPLARMELVESLARALGGVPVALALAGEPESRGTFVLRGFHRVPVGGRRAMAEPFSAVEVIVAKRDGGRLTDRADRLGGRRLHPRRGRRRADVGAGDGDPAQRHGPRARSPAGPTR